MEKFGVNEIKATVDKIKQDVQEITLRAYADANIEKNDDDLAHLQALTSAIKIMNLIKRKIENKKVKK